jgi:hypothetical protein
LIPLEYWLLRILVKVLGSDRREKGVDEGKRIARRSESIQDDVRHDLTYKIAALKPEKDHQCGALSNCFIFRMQF